MKHSHVLCVLRVMFDVYLPYTVQVTFPQVETLL